MSDHQIPAIVENVFDRPLVMGAIDLRREQVTAVGIMPLPDESITDSAAVFASDQDAHEAKFTDAAAQKL